MTMMNYNDFKKILNENIFEKSKSDLLEKIANSPSRFIGLFRPTKPKAKIMQNLLQSNEIHFGDAIEKLFEEYFKIIGFDLLSKRYITAKGEILNIDQCVKKDNKIYFIEQKVRDDHDSTKKRGQIDNFKKKLNILLSIYNENNLEGIFYFLDPEFSKNKNFYTTELEKMHNDYNVKTSIFYGKELFDYFNYPDIWNEINLYLAKWKEEIPDLPEINFDIDADMTFNEIKDINPSIFRKLFSNNDIFNKIILTLFPEKKTLNLLLTYFQSKDLTIYKTLAENLETKLKIM